MSQPPRGPRYVPHRRPIGLLAAGCALFLPGCAASTSHTHQTSASASTASTTSARLESKQLDLICTGEAAEFVHNVSLGNIDRDLAVAWSGTGRQQHQDYNETFLVAAWITDPDSQKSRTVGWKTFANGQKPVQYILDNSTGHNRYVPANKQSDPALYPGALDGMGPGWTATATAEIDGVTVSTCSTPATSTSVSSSSR